MKLFDLHCDTLYRAYTENGSFFEDHYHISYDKTKNIAPYLQCMAVWIPDEYRGESAVRLFEGCLDKLREQLAGSGMRQCVTFDEMQDAADHQEKAVVLTVEGGAVLAGELERIGILKKAGVRIMTLTWNGRNELGDGVGLDNAGGLTDFGKQALKAMEQADIAADISHASERLFYDVAQYSTRPFLATHSNAKAVCPHKRNLTDEQFSIIQQKGGIVGLNFCRDFLHKQSTNAKMYDIIRNAEHFLSLGGEETLAIGSDFDGCDIPSDMQGIASMPTLYEMFLHHNYSEALLQDIFFHNALRFFQRYETAPVSSEAINRKKEMV